VSAIRWRRIDLSRSSRLVAIVAADTEDEAREIASKHDAFRRDWRDPLFAACDNLETSATDVFGDVIFRSEPVVVGSGSVRQSAGKMGRAWFWFVFRP
jgi:hypothetical protein